MEKDKGTHTRTTSIAIIDMDHGDQPALLKRSQHCATRRARYAAYKAVF